MTEPFDPDDLIVDGITNTVDLLGDADFTMLAAQAYRPVRAVVQPLLQPGDVVRLTLPTLLLLTNPTRRPSAVALFLDNRLILAWTIGVFKKTAHHVVLRTDEITEVSVGNGTGSASAATVLTVRAGNASWDLVLPQSTPAFADHAKELLTGTPR